MRKCLPSITLIVLVAAGCQTTDTPDWYDPGSTEYQQSSAQRFDPYPEPDTGPEVMGGRPREFSEPTAEPSRARWDGASTWRKRFGF